MGTWGRACRTVGLAWVGAGLAFQLVEAVVGPVVPGPVTLVIGTAVLLLAGATVLARGRRVGGWGLAVLLALDLGGAVADRFGAWGRPGAPGVSWGSWEAFVAYTARLLPGVAAPVVEVAAVAATATEVALAVLLLSGWRPRWTGLALAGLFVVYLVTMAGTVGMAAVAQFSLPLLVGGALLTGVRPGCRDGATARVDLPVAPDAGLGVTR